MSAWILPVAWLILCGLCLERALHYAPPPPEKRRHYLVCYQAEGGVTGNMDASVKMPLTAVRITELRECIERMDSVGGKRVVITSLTELEP